MKRYIVVKDRLVEIPAKMQIRALRESSVKRVLEAVEEGMDRDLNTVAVVGSLIIKGGLAVRIVTKYSGGLIYWVVQDWFGKHAWSGGFFKAGTNENIEEAAVALPAMRGRGLYPAVLKYIRKEYKKPLLSDRVMSLPNILSWVRMEASVGVRRFRINPRSWLYHFAALETITV